MDARVLITGASGFVGEELLVQAPQHCQVIAVYRQHAPVHAPSGTASVQADLTDRAAVGQLLRQYQPDLIINAAAWVEVDACETDRAKAELLNVEIVRSIVDQPLAREVPFIQISTDYIFAGREAPAREDEAPEPLNFYGRTKLMAEQYLTAHHAQTLIARTCALFGDPRRGRTNLLRSLVANLVAGKPFQAAADLFANPISVENLARLLWEAVDRRMQGIVHLGGIDYLSRFEFSRLAAEMLGLDDKLVQPVAASESARPAMRPKFGGLNIDRSRMRFETPFLSVRDSLGRIRAAL